MFGIGMPEMFLLLAVALIVIGPKKLPDLAKSLGRALGEFRKATTDIKESMVDDSELEDVKTAFKDLNDGINDPIGAKSSAKESTTFDSIGKNNQTPPEPSKKSTESDNNA